MSHFETPLQAIAAEVGYLTAPGIIEALRKAGWIIVRHDAIKLAQAHARADSRAHK